jgi:prophage maintenance system killer protein
MDKIHYITPENLIEIVDIIQSFDYIDNDEIPKYDDQPDKIDDYFALIDRLKNDIYYPDIFAKAATLFLNLNSHYFANGNKRLAVFSMTFFLENNSWTSIKMSKMDYGNVIVKIFGDHELEDYENFSSTDFAMYNVALTTAQFNQNGVDFDDGKVQMERFLKEVFIKQLKAPL